VAGRQRMLSQKIGKTALIAQHAGSAEERRRYAAVLLEEVSEWEQAHYGLRYGDALLRLGGDNSDVVNRLFDRLEPAFQQTRNAARTVAFHAGAATAVRASIELSVATVLRNEPVFLQTMEEVVAVYEREARTRVARLEGNETGLAWALVVVLLLEALLVFRPAVKSIRRTMLDLMRAQADAVDESLHDGLTGVANRRFFDEALARECRRASRNGSPLSLVVIDLDHFKKFNDAEGHLRGDECLTRVAQCLTSQVKRPGDFVARYGGDEFVVILPETTPAGARAVAEAIKRDVEALEIRPSGDGIPLSVSIGLATAEEPTLELVPSHLFSAADTALLRAKSTARGSLATAAPVVSGGASQLQGAG